MMWTTQPRSKLGGLAAITTGRGQDILLLHGVGLRAEAWGAQLAGLAAFGRLTASDMPGHGESEPLAQAQDIEDYVKAARGVLDALSSPALVVGHSMGAMIALSLARSEPAQVCGVVALNAVFERSAQAAEAVCTRAAHLDGKTPADPSPTLRRWFGETTSPERTACEMWLTSVDPAAYKIAYAAFAQSKVPDQALLTGLECPALFVTGDLEPNATPEMADTMARLAPRGRAQVVAGAAHMMPMTHPDPVNTALRGFLEEVSS